MQQKKKLSERRIVKIRQGKPRSTRAERAERVRDALFKAAAEIVGKYGYVGASISRITAKAKVAQGTFYNYFESRQHLLDQLLPVLGEGMLDYIAAETRKCTIELEREEKRFSVFFQYLIEAPEFYRILNEAELFAPTGHREHLENISAKYLRALKRAWAAGDLPGYEEDELEAIVFVLMAARSYLSLRYAYWDGKVKQPPESMFRAYGKFIRHGLFGGRRSKP